MKVFMGIDQSFTSTGTCLVDETGSVVGVGVITSNKTLDSFERAWTISQYILSVVFEYKPLNVGIEGLAFGGVGDATRQLAGLQYTIVNSLRKQASIDCCIVAPTTVKKFATTKGKASKQEMVDALPKEVLGAILEKNYKKTTGLYDVTDAYFIAMYTLEEYKKSLQKPQ